MMPSDYLVWAAGMEKGQNYCVLDDMDNVDDDFELKEGIPRAKGFPDNAVMSMDPEYPKDMALADNVFNLCRLVVVSKRLKEFIESRNPKNLEYLRVGILNHKKRLASKEYFIVHPIHPQDCLDAKKSGAEWSDIIKDDIDEIKEAGNRSTQDRPRPVDLQTQTLLRRRPRKEGLGRGYLGRRVHRHPLDRTR